MPAKGQKTGKPSPTRMNLVGRRFTRLTVVRDIGNHPTTKESYWECKCDCGKVTKVTGYCLTSGNTKSCGCYHKIRTRELFSKPLKELRVNRVLFDYRKRSRQKGLDFTLDTAQFEELMNSDCYYCGAGPSNSIVQHGQALPVYQGIDRMDNDLGYTPDNVVPCCITCNKMKKAMSHDEFLLHIHAIASRFMTEPPQPDFYVSSAEGVLCISE